MIGAAEQPCMTSKGAPARFMIGNFNMHELMNEQSDSVTAQVNPTAQALGRMARGKRKVLSVEESQRRRERMVAMNKTRAKQGGGL